MTKTGAFINCILSSHRLSIDEDLINGIISPNPTNEQNGHEKEDDRPAVSCDCLIGQPIKMEVLGRGGESFLVRYDVIYHQQHCHYDPKDSNCISIS